VPTPKVLADIVGELLAEPACRHPFQTVHEPRQLDGGWEVDEEVDVVFFAVQGPRPRGRVAKPDLASPQVSFTSGPTWDRARTTALRPGEGGEPPRPYGRCSFEDGAWPTDQRQGTSCGFALQVLRLWWSRALRRALPQGSVCSGPEHVAISVEVVRLSGDQGGPSPRPPEVGERRVINPRQGPAGNGGAVGRPGCVAGKR